MKPGKTLQLALYLRFTRPFTLLPPLIGMLSGAATALAAMAARRDEGLGEAVSSLGGWTLGFHVAMGALLAAALNAGSNILNQWTDLENDRINKPHRPLPQGLVSGKETAALVVFFYALAILLAAAIRPEGRWHTLVVVLGGVLATLAYSLPPLRTKRFGTSANLTIALARGCLLKVAGWSCVAGVLDDAEPWFIGGVFMLFLTGASSTKDFADMPGDRAAGCETWPIKFGPQRAARLMAPFFVLPWLLLPIGSLWPVEAAGRSHLLSAPWSATMTLGLLLSAYGLYVAKLILDDPDALASSENHPSWKHMYRQMMAAQIGLIVVYLF